MSSSPSPLDDLLRDTHRHYRQLSEEWFEARKSLITASSAASALPRSRDVIGPYLARFPAADVRPNPLTSCNPYCSYRQYVLEKSSPAPKFVGNAATRWGQKYEAIALAAYETLFGKTTHEFGLIRHPTEPWIGASPDGITTDSRVVEIKCPMSRRITGIPPLYYWIQMQLLLEVCRMDVCDFIECAFEEFTTAADLRARVDDDPGTLTDIVSTLPCPILEANNDAGRTTRMYGAFVVGEDAVKPVAWSRRLEANTDIDRLQQAAEAMLAEAGPGGSILYFFLRQIVVTEVPRAGEAWFTAHVRPYLRNAFDTIRAFRTDHVARGRWEVASYRSSPTRDWFNNPPHQSGAAAKPAPTRYYTSAYTSSSSSSSSSSDQDQEDQEDQERPCRVRRLAKKPRTGDDGDDGTSAARPA